MYSKIQIQIRILDLRDLNFIIILLYFFVASKCIFESKHALEDFAAFIFSSSLSSIGLSLWARLRRKDGPLLPVKVGTSRKK